MSTPSLSQILHKIHQEKYPNCTYGDKPHFVPPSFGTIGFYLCNPPEDITNHSRCRTPYDHEHPDHYPTA